MALLAPSRSLHLVTIGPIGRLGAPGNSPPAVWFAYSADRKGEHPRQHLKNFQGRCRRTPTPAFIIFTMVVLSMR
jgi:hypothetical protein